MTGSALVQAMIEILTAGLTGIATAMGSAISAICSGIFFTTTGTGENAVTSISIFGICILAFAGISLSLSLFRWVLNFFTSLGQRNR